MKILFRLLALVLCCVSVSSARANSHLWRVREIFSTADGSVQYVEMWCPNTGENAITGDVLICTNATTTNTFTFSQDVVGDTANRRLLLATAGFDALNGGVTPDFILPAGFLVSCTGTVSYAGVDVSTYTDLPGDGVASMQRSVTGYTLSATNNPQNFAGQIGSVSNLPAAIPIICQQPASVTATEFANFSMSAHSTGTQPLGFQWYRNDVSVGGANASTYSTAATVSSAGSYTLVITNNAGAITSSVAIVTVNYDLVSPTVAIGTPVANFHTAARSLKVSGTAKDDVGVAQVLCRVLPSATFSAATLSSGAKGVTNWNIQLALNPGTNIVEAKSLDAHGNESATRTRMFFYDVRSSLTLATNGFGHIVNLTNGQQLLVGRSYNVIAMAGSNYVFTNWTGSVTSSAATLRFLMQSNMVLTANFVTNAFIALSGQYNGLFSASGERAHYSSGFITATVEPTQRIAGKLLVDGDTVPFVGKLQLDGTCEITTAPRDLTKSPLKIALRLSHTTKFSLTGTIETVGLGSEPSWTADVEADREGFNKSDNLATAWQGQYTFLIPPGTPAGYGYGLVTVSSNGFVTTKGNLADGSAILQTVPLSTDAKWPFYMPLYVGTNKNYTGSIMGWITLSNDSSGSLAPFANLSWIKTVGTTAYYPSGFTNTAAISGSSYVPPRPKDSNPPNFRTLNLSAVTVTIDGGNISAPIALSGIYTGTNTVSLNSQPKFALAINRVNGFMTGQFADPDHAGKVTRFVGAVLQNQNIARGYFIGAVDSDGSVALDPATAIPTTVEASVIPTSGGTFYLSGGPFRSNDTVLVDGKAATNVVLIDSNTLQVTFGVLADGTHTVVLSNTVTHAVTTIPNGLTANGSGRTDEVPPGIGGSGPVICGRVYRVCQRRAGNASWRTTGEVTTQQVDLDLPGVGLDVTIARTYRSKNSPQSALGTGWDFSYNVYVVSNAQGMVVHDGDGRADTFVKQKDGSYALPEFFRRGTIDAKTKSFTLEFADHGRWVFNSLAAGSKAGKLSQIIDRNSNTVALAYSSVGRLTNIVDTLGRSISLGYTPSGALATVTDFIGRTVRYEYNVNGDLAQVVSPSVTGTPTGNDFPGGITNSYIYTSGFADDRLNHNLESVVDGSGEQIVNIAYTTTQNRTDSDFDRVASLALGTNTPTIYTYEIQTPSSTNHFATTKAIVNDPVGNVTEVLCDAKNCPVNVRRLGGRSIPENSVTSTDNRPTNKLRTSDPDYFETTISYNADSLPVKVTYPRSGTVEYVYEGDINAGANPRERGNLRVMRQTAAPGVPSDQKEIVDQWEYVPGFGTLETYRESDDVYMDVENAHFYRDNGRSSGNGTRFGTIKSCPSGATITYRVEKGKNILLGQIPNCPADAIISKYTDPRGNVTTANYDANGNCVQKSEPVVSGGGFKILYFTYNSHGQLTAITNAVDANGDRRVDTYNYFTSGSQQGYLQSAVIDANGLALTTTYACDAVGNVTQVTDPRGNDSQFVYNQLDDVVQAKSATGGSGVRTVTSYKYIPRSGWIGVRSSFSCASLSSIDTTYFDNDGKSIDGGLLTTSFGYDSIGQLTSVTNSAGGVMAYAYNAAGELVLASSPEAVNGNQPGNVISYSYDERGLPFQTIAAPGTADQSTTQYDYDADGNLHRLSEGLEQAARITTIETDGFSDVTDCDDKDPKRHHPTARLNGGGGSTTASGGYHAHLDVLDCADDPTSIMGWSSSAGGCKNQTSGIRAVYKHMSCLAGRNYPSCSVQRHFIGHHQNAQFSSSLHVSGLKEEIRENDDGSCRIHSITDPLGNVATFHYDASGHCISTTVTGDTGAKNPDSTPVIAQLSSTSATYDALGRLTSAKNNPLYEDGQAGSNPFYEDKNIFVYDDADNTTAITNGMGNATTFGYDTAGRLSSVTDPKGNSSSYTYDPNGNVLTETTVHKSDLGNTDLVIATTNIYDNLDRCTNSSSNIGGPITSQYDSVGDVTRVTDALGYSTDYEYDGNGYLKRTIWGIGGNISFSSIDRDGNSRVTTTTDANGHATDYSYDAFDRPTGITFADGTTSSCTYDVHGNVMSSTDQNGTTITNTYDLRNGLVHRDVAARNILVADSTTSERFSYDGLGRTVFAANDVSTNIFTYDALGRLATENQNGLLMSHTYDAIGNCLSVSYPGGRKIVYAYDAANFCRSAGEETVNAADGTIQTTVLSSNFYNGGLLEKKTRPGGYTAIGYGINVGAQGLSCSVNHYSNGGSLGDVLIAGSVAQWDSAGNLSIRSNTLTGVIQQYAYDELYRLTNSIVTSNADVLRDTSYSLDAGGNRLNVTGDNHPGAYTLDASEDALTGEPGDAQMNQYTTTPIGDLQYDKNGNRLALSSGGVPQQAYVYDCFNRLVVFSNFVSGVTAYYGYDASGRRLWKTTVGTDAIPHSTWFVYDGAEIIEEYDGNSNLAATYVCTERIVGGDRSRPVDNPIQLGLVAREMGHNWGMQHDSTGNTAHELGHNWGMQHDSTGNLMREFGHNFGMSHDPVSGGNFMTTRGVVPRREIVTLTNLRTTGSSSNYWLLTDDQGSAVALSLDDGSVVERYNYADCGEPQFLDGNGILLLGADGTTPATESVVGNIFLFGGVEYDSETGLYAPQGSVLVDPAIGTTLQDDTGDAAAKIQARDACNNKIRIGGEDALQRVEGGPNLDGGFYTHPRSYRVCQRRTSSD